MAPVVKPQSALVRNSIRPGETRPRPMSKSPQAHPGVSPLHPVSHRNVSFQPLPRPLGLPPYHYDLAENFPAIGDTVAQARKLVFHVVGDSGGVQDGEFQNNVATPFIVTGNGGYHNLHAVHSDPGEKSADTGAVLKYVQAKAWGFMTLTIDHNTISGATTEVDRNGDIKGGADTFSYTAKPIILKTPKSVPTL
jgi:hypothetical protein